MKRYISLILAAIMLVGCFAVNVFAADSKDYTDAENFALSLGVIDRETYDADALVTRAEFAEIVARFCGLKDPDAEYKQWNDTAFGEDDKDEAALGTTAYAFSDIDVSLPQYEAISAVCANGYMNGVTSTHFLPNYNITLGATVKVIVCMLGYDSIAQIKGGWPNGYLSVGDSLGVRKGISAGINDFVTYGQCLQMLYNVLDIGVYDFSSLDEDGITYERGESFLNSVLEMYRVTGVLSDNGITTFSGKSKVGTDAIVVDGVTLVTNKAEFHSAAYLGREVEAYYKENKSGKNELVHLTVLNDDAITIASEDFIGYKSDKISYEDKNGKVVTKNLSANSYLIHNNKAKSDYTSDVFDFPFGEITLLKSGNGSEYDTIVINEYSAGKVRKVDSEEGVVYLESLYKGVAGIKTIELDEDSSIVALLNSTGDAIAMEDIRVGDVISALVSEDGEYTEAYVSNKMVEGFVVSEYESDSDSFTVSGGETAYTFRNIGDMTNIPVINIGDGYDIHFDYAGNPVWIEKGSAEISANMAFLIQAGSNSNGFNKEYAIQLYTQNALIETFTIGERVVLNNASKDTADVISEIQAAADEVILYTTNEDGTQIKSITLPLDMGEEDKDNRGWYHITPKVRIAKNEGESTEDWAAYVNANGMMFSQRGTSFNKAMHYAAGKTKVFSVPTDRDSFDDERRFSTTSDSFSSLSNQTVNGYATKSNAILADAVAWSTSNLSGAKVSALQVFLITKITRGLNEDEEEVTYLNGYIIDGNNWTSKTDKFVFTDKTVFVDAKTSPKIVDPTSPDFDMEANGPARFEDLEVGDIIRYSVNELNELVSLRVAYDCSTGKGYTAGTDPKTYFYFYEGGIDAGYPLYVEGTHVRLSSDLPHNVDMTDTEYMINYEKVMACDVKANTVFVVEDGVHGKTVRKGSIEDIQTFEDTGELDASEYDRVAVPTYWGKTIGTVIYK